MQSIPQPKPKFEAVGDQPITLIDIVNPSIVLMDANKSVQVLLSRNTLMEPHAIHLRGVRLIEIPLGWRLALVRLASRYSKMRLPDEIEFDALHIDTGNIPSRVLAEDIVIGQVKIPNFLIELAGAEFKDLCKMNGRELLRWVTERFGLARRGETGLPMKRRRAA